ACAPKPTCAEVLVVVHTLRGRQHDREMDERLESDRGGEIPLEHVLVLHLRPGTGHVLPRCHIPHVQWHVWHQVMGAARVDREALDALAPQATDPAQLLLT